MIMVADFLPGLKRWMGSLSLSPSGRGMTMRVIVAFLLHAGRMSCLQAAGAVRCEVRHRAQISRFLNRPRWRRLDLNSVLRQNLLERESRKGPFLSLVVGTLCGQAGKKPKTLTAPAIESGDRERGVATANRLGWRGPPDLFDIETKPQNCHARRRENPDDERPATESAGCRSSCFSRN